MYKSIYFIALFFIILFSNCKIGHRDYYYLIENSTETIGPVVLTYQIAENTETFTKTLLPEEPFFEIYKRPGVSGDDIWNIETSSSLYAITSLIGMNEEGDRMTENLSIRSYWPGLPEKVNGNGVYKLEITDDLFVLSRQSGYNYAVLNSLSDTLFVTVYLHGQSRQRDTLLAGELKRIGSNEIFTYPEEYNNMEKYKERKLSGISSLLLKYRQNSITLNLKNYKLFDWEIGKDQTTFKIDESYFQ
jgi:hypothetical protein